MAVLIGANTGGTTNDFNTAGFALAVKRTALANGGLRSLWFHPKSTTNPLLSSAQLGIYADDAGGTDPGTLLGKVVLGSGPKGINKFGGMLPTTLNVVAGTTYWLAVTSLGEDFNWQGDASGVGPGYREKSVSGVLPSPWGTAGTNGAATPIIWGEDTKTAWVAAESVLADGTTDTTTHAVPYPAPTGGILANDLLICCVGMDSVTGSVTFPAGWTELFDTRDATNVINAACAWKRAAGGETGTFTVTSSAAENGGIRCLCIRDADPSFAPETPGVATASSTNPNPPSADPAVWNTPTNMLWIAMEANDGNVLSTAAPAGYHGFGSTIGAHATAASRANVATAWTQTSAGSEDPGVFTMAIEQWVASTIAVGPAPGPYTLLGVVARATTFGAVTAGQVTAGSGPTTHFGVVARASTFGAVTQGQRKTFGVVARTSTFGAVTAGQSSTPSTGTGYREAVLLDNPAVYWRMGDNDVIQLEENGGTPLQLYGATANVAGATTHLGPAVSFDGFSNYGLSGSEIDLSYTDVVTAEFWLYQDFYGNTDNLALEFGKQNDGAGFWINPNDNTGIWSASMPAWRSDSIPRPSAATWHHFAVVFRRNLGSIDTNSVVIYVDGVQVPDTVYVTSNPIFTFGFLPLTVMARTMLSGDTSLHNSGDMQHLAIYDYALSPTRVAAHYAARNGAGTGGPTTHYGVVARATTFGEVTQASRKTFGVVARATTLGAVVTGSRKAFGQSAMAVTVARAVQGQRKTFGQVARASTFGAVISAQRKTYGQLVQASAFGAVTQGRRKTFGSVAMPVSAGLVTQGRRKAFGSTVTPIVFTAVVDGRRLAAGNYGSVAAVFAFGSVTQGRRKTFGVVARPSTFGAVTAAQRKAFGQVARASTFAAATVGSRRTFGQVARAVTFLAAVSGQASTGVRTLFGALTAPWTFSRVTQAKRRTFAQVTQPTTIQVTTVGQRTTKSRIKVPMILTLTTEGRRVQLGSISLPLTATLTTSGLGQLSTVRLVLRVDDRALEQILLGTEPLSYSVLGDHALTRLVVRAENACVRSSG